MGNFTTSVSPETAAWIADQHLFFVATAPLDPTGHVNLSPKGLETFVLLGPSQAAYLDLTGSGAETLAHLRENGRITIMFCAFDGNPDVVRIYGTGRVVFPGDDGFDGLLARFRPYPGVRSVIVVDIERVGSSCGFGVPMMSFDGDRDRLIRWANAKGEQGIAAYWASKNAVSLDGLAAVVDR